MTTVDSVEDAIEYIKDHYTDVSSKTSLVLYSSTDCVSANLCKNATKEHIAHLITLLLNDSPEAFSIALQWARKKVKALNDLKKEANNDD